MYILQSSESFRSLELEIVFFAHEHDADGRQTDRPTDWETRFVVKTSKETVRKTRQTLAEVLFSQSKLAVDLVEHADSFCRFNADNLGDRYKTLAAMVSKAVSEAIPKRRLTPEELERVHLNLQKVSRALNSK